MTFVLEMIRLGIGNLRRHVLRSVLTALGIILGVAAVIVMVSIGEGRKREALLQLEALGATNIIIRSQQPPESAQAGGGQGQRRMSRYGLTRTDLEVLERSFPDAAAVVPTKQVGSQVMRGNLRKVSQAIGTTPELPKVTRVQVARGRYLSDEDMTSQAKVAVIGAQIARQFFPAEDPIGQTIQIDQQVMTVVGVLRAVGLAGGAGSSLVGRDLNLDVHIPLSTARAVFSDQIFRSTAGNFNISEVQVYEVFIQAPSRERVPMFDGLARRILEVRHPGMSDIEMIVPYELLEEARRTALTWQVVLGFIAGIALLVGGIGIMNIMLATVTERTREIGIRRALGATRGHIVTQFVVETGVLSALGGVVGVLLGVGASVGLGWSVPRLHEVWAIGRYFSEDLSLPTELTGWSIAVAFAVAVTTGLGFGIYPAVRASRQDPIVALRHD